MEIIKPGIDIDFISKRRLFALVSVGMVSASILLMVVIGPNYGIDFEGGTNIIVSFQSEVEPRSVTEAMRTLGFEEPLVQQFGGADENQFLLQTNRTSAISTDDAARIELLLIGEFSQNETGDDIRFDFDPRESADRIDVRLPHGAFDEIGDDWTPPIEDDGSGEGTGQHLAEVSGFGQVRPQEAYLAYLLGDLENARVTMVGNPRQNRFVIRLQGLQGLVEQGFIDIFGEDLFNKVERVESVGPRVGEQLRDDGIKAVIMALFFILVYIGLRFNMRFAPGAVVALFHDVLITLGILTLIQEEITLTILAALLTIVGYSLNDTIVVFDRIRENLGSLRTKDMETVVNRSINETLSRTLLTSVTTLIAVFSIYFLGGGLIKAFALAMIIGIVVGTYSSIYIASPFMIWLHNYLEKRSTKQRKTGRPGRSPAKKKSP